MKTFSYWRDKLRRKRQSLLGGLISSVGIDLLICSILLWPDFGWGRLFFFFGFQRRRVCAHYSRLEGDELDEIVGYGCTRLAVCRWFFWGVMLTVILWMIHTLFYVWRSFDHDDGFFFLWSCQIPPVSDKETSCHSISWCKGTSFVALGSTTNCQYSKEGSWWIVMMWYSCCRNVLPLDFIPSVLSLVMMTVKTTVQHTLWNTSIRYLTLE